MWSYSNSGYVLLGSIIEEVAGQSYRQFLDGNIFKPLGMADTGYDLNTAIIGHRAEGYASLNRRASYIDMSLPYAAGGLYSTVEDLYRWIQALYGWEVVLQDSWDAMLAAAVPAPDTPDAFGAYGLFNIPIRGHTSIGHDSNINGFRANIIHLTTEHMDFVILSNLETVNTNRILDSLVGIVFDEG
jgi:CubicO group peptidase (beta-lactamase class C family)